MPTPGAFWGSTPCWKGPLEKNWGSQKIELWKIRRLEVVWVPTPNSLNTAIGQRPCYIAGFCTFLHFLIRVWSFLKFWRGQNGAFGIPDMDAAPKFTYGNYSTHGIRFFVLFCRFSHIFAAFVKSLIDFSTPIAPKWLSFHYRYGSRAKIYIWHI